MKSLLRKRLLMLSALLLTICGQMWAGRRGVAGASDTYNGINYTLYSDYSYYCYWSELTAGYGNVAVITSCSNSTMVIPESLGGCSQIVIGEEALTSDVKSLTISKSVRVLEYCAVYYANQIETLIIEDSETPLYCGGTKYTYSYGAFSFIKKLKSVYIGRDLEYEHYNGDYTYAPFRYCDSSGNFDVTIGPRVKMIADYCFEGCNIKSIKAMPQNPPYCGTDAFGGVTNSIPVYVSYKTIDAYKAHSDWKYFTNYVLDTDLCKADALNDLDAEAGENPSLAVQGVVSNYKGLINSASSGDDVVAKLNAGKAAIQLQKAKDSAIAALNAEAGNAPSQTVANVRDTWIANVNNATTVDDVNTCKSNGIAAIQLQKAKDDAIAALTEAKVANPSGAADGIFDTYKARIEAATSIDDVIAAKEEGIKKLQEYVEELKAQKASAKAELDAAKSQYPSEYADDIVNNCKTEIEAATTIEDVKNAKDKGIKNLKLEYNNLLSIKNAAIVELENAKEQYPSANASSIVAEGKNAINAATSKSAVGEKEKFYIDQLETAFEAELTNAKNDAINALNQAKNEYPSDAAERIVSNYTDIINAATSTDVITAAKEEGIQALKDANELQEAKEAAISYLNDAKKDYPSDEFEDIVSIYTDKINAATSTDAVTAIKNEGIQALAYAAEMPTVLHINFAEGSAPIEKEHYMTASKFTLDEDCNVVLTVNDNSVTYPWDMAGKITLFKGAPAVELKANKDPNGSEYYTTFYSSLEAYTIPEGVKAYTATLDEGQDGVIHLNEVKDDIIPAETAVVLISESGSYSAHASDYAISETEEERGILKGIDVEIPVPDDNCYVLSGTSKLGMGLYPWTGTGKTLAANKAYLQLTSASPAKAFTFVFDEETTSIHNSQFIIHNSENDAMYNLNGVRVNDSYKGIVIKNGKKTLNK